MINLLTPFLIALQFLTILPPAIRRIFTPGEMGRAVGFFPLVGLGLGGLLYSASILLGLLFPTPVQAALVLALWVILTGALHLDGFLDSLDGLLGGFTPEKRLEIMHDERVGAFGLAGGVLLLLLKFSALQILLGHPSALIGLLLAPVFGRWAMTLAIFAFPYARENGLGRDIKDQTTWVEVNLAGVTAILLAWFSLQWQGLLLAAATVGLVWVVGRYILKRIPGLTGDNYGALCELVELLVLLGLIVRLTWMG